jgi:Xaa-Pro aminopeptidase
MTMSNPTILLELIEKKQKDLKETFLKQDISAVYFPVSNPFLAEMGTGELTLHELYTGFTGSTARGIYITNLEKVFLFVGGIYHEQALLQCSKSYVEVIPTIDKTFIQCIDELKEKFSIKNIAIDDRYVSLIEVETIKDKFEINYIQIFPSILKKNLIIDSIFSRNYPDLPENSLYITASPDEVAWLSGMRSYAIPFSSGLPGRAFYDGKNSFIYFPYHEVSFEKNLQQGDSSSFIYRDEKLLYEYLKEKKIQFVYCHKDTITLDFFHKVQKLYPEAKFKFSYPELIKQKNIKNSFEKKSMLSAFEKSSRALVTTLKWIKNQSKEFSEQDIHQQLEKNFIIEGMKGYSFRSIIAAGDHSSIIHYGQKDNQPIPKNVLIMIDCGAYYKEGYATDCTRTIFFGENPLPWQKEIYTLVLKASLKAFSLHFPKNWTGQRVDQEIRTVIQNAGYQYHHGTGHGIGIPVHEKGHSISPHSSASLEPMIHGAATSLEPGIYIPQKGGVRLENIAFVEDSPIKDHFYFNLISYVGFDESLILWEQLSQSEKDILLNYEKECFKKGTHLDLKILEFLESSD